MIIYTFGLRQDFPDHVLRRKSVIFPGISMNHGDNIRADTIPISNKGSLSRTKKNEVCIRKA